MFGDVVGVRCSTVWPCEDQVGGLPGVADDQSLLEGLLPPPAKSGDRSFGERYLSSRCGRLESLDPGWCALLLDAYHRGVKINMTA